MEIRGIDVSAWQGKIDWKTVADYGMGFAILRITEAGNVIDSYFEQNFSERIFSVLYHICKSSSV